MKRLLSVCLATMGLGVLLLVTGCDALAVTDVGYVTGQARKYSRLVCEKKFGEADEFFFPNMVWQAYNGPKVSGQAGIDAFRASLGSIQNMDTFYFYVHGKEKLDHERVVLDVTMQAHCVVNSMTMVYDNTVWRAKMLWVRTDTATWKIGGIFETTGRVKADPPKDIKPL